MVEIVNGRVYVDGKETVNPTLIGYAIIDFAETQENDFRKIILKEQDVFIESFIEA
jgi:ribosomal protein S19